MSEPLRTEAARLKAQRDGGVIQVNDGDNFECIVCGAISSFLYGLVHATACYVDLREAENARLTSEVSRLQRVADDAMARAEHFALHGDGPYRLCSDCQDAAIARGKRTKRAAALAPQEAHR